MAKEFQVTYDCADPGAQAAFWAQALGYRVQGPPAGFPDWTAALTARGVPPEHHNDQAAITDPDGKGPRLFFQKVPEGKTAAKNRLHLDVRAAPGLIGDERMAVLETEATRLEGLGANRLYRLDADDQDEGIIVMTDPEGNEFCLD
ncbi:VOC family protein [Streptomyces sp. NBC_00249]|uniref:VOC family protein n=1 Tax=Streptomyces sp. NBC_00249 TaxID=2975690 RepID=UPI0022542B4C|nr:VOC family protein [Streptomyces sp. NBC_00249]MCX5195620.1 VOC family protein [Streptomyces sp. NBC_00249]